MSYIPKYILKRLFPKDFAKLKDDGVEFTFQNILSPMKVEDIPDGEEYLARFSIKIDGTEVPMETMKNAKITANGKEYSAMNVKEMEGQVIPVGGEIIVFAPVTEFAGKKLEKGNEHEFHMVIKTGNGGENAYGPIKRSIH